MINNANMANNITCRTGSLEIQRYVGFFDFTITCRTGSLENSIKANRRRD